MAQNNYFLAVNLTGSDLSATINNVAINVLNGQSSGLKKFNEMIDYFTVDIKDINNDPTRTAFIPNFSIPSDNANPSNINSFTIFEFTPTFSINVYVENSRSFEAFY